MDRGEFVLSRNVGAGLAPPVRYDSAKLIAPVRNGMHQTLPLEGQIPPIRGKCPAGTKGVGTGGSRSETDEEKSGTF